MRPWVQDVPESMPAADALTWAHRLLAVSAAYPVGPEGFNAASAAIDELLVGLSVEAVREVACALALMPRVSVPVQPLLLRGELDRLGAAIAWGFS